MQSRDDWDPRSVVIDAVIKAAHATGDAVDETPEADDSQPAVAQLEGMPDVRDRLFGRLQALLTEIDQCEPGEEEWW